MELQTSKRVTTEAKIENLRDLWDSERGSLKRESVRSVTVEDALVDTGATMLSLPTSIIKQLGLSQTRSRKVKSSLGPGEVSMYDAVRLTIMGRECTIDVLDVPDTIPVLIGQIPLEMLDFVVDLRGRKLIGNPEHGGEQMFEMY